MKGVAVEGDVKREILLLASDCKERSSAYFKKNVKSATAKNTVDKYLKQLVNKDYLIDVMLSEGTFKTVFKINNKGLKMVNRIKSKNKIDEILDELNDEQIRNYASALLDIHNSPEGGIWRKDKDGLSYHWPSFMIDKAIEEADLERHKEIDAKLEEKIRIYNAEPMTEEKMARGRQNAKGLRAMRDKKQMLT